MTTDRWRPVPEWEGAYEVSDQGRVRSMPRWAWSSRGKGHWFKAGGIVLSPGIVSGYARVVLQRDKAIKNVSIHRLVLLAFVGPCPAGMEACHHDDDRLNNVLTNLRWDTKPANCADRTRNGGSPNALKTHCPKGHPYSPENTVLDHGSRRCRTCRRLHWKKESAA